MQDIYEIRFHGRGGQGAKTAAMLLAETIQETGKFIQGFSEYGPERQGAPIQAFTRFSDRPITIHSGVKSPDMVVVIDPTLVKAIPVAEGLKQGGILLINTSEPEQAVRERLGYRGELYLIDATRIALEEIGKAITNTAMLGAIIKAKEFVPPETLKGNLRERFIHKMGEDLTNRNIRAFNRAYAETRRC
ncbi:2-oxoacid:acceptor oxidoreductase family protein [Candidatus Woesearchaeota archaeon]|nr:2-oxoacid:acceptor oxidoreductase family protein [Candidatus Woesearchaeota archaeon]